MDVLARFWMFFYGFGAQYSLVRVLGVAIIVDSKLVVSDSGLFGFFGTFFEISKWLFRNLTWLFQSLTWPFQSLSSKHVPMVVSD